MHCVGCYVYGDVIATSNLVVDIREWNRKCVCVCWGVVLKAREGI